MNYVNLTLTFEKLNMSVLHLCEGEMGIESVSDNVKLGQCFMERWW